MNILDCLKEIQSEKVKNTFAYLYGDDIKTIEAQTERYKAAIESFQDYFPSRTDISIYSASGRTEIGGNHTDHQRGTVLAGAVNLDVIAVVAFHNDGVVRLKSKGYLLSEIKIEPFTPDERDDGTTAIIKGIITKFSEMGIDVKGFDMYTTSDVISGGGISSSAAFETVIATAINIHYNQGKCNPFEIAKTGWFAENKFFGKKCGLLDQTVSSYGGLVSVDFANEDNPEIERISFDFEKFGYTLCIIDTNSSHENLTEDYVDIRKDMKAVADYFDRDVLSEVDENMFYSCFKNMRDFCSDKAILRAMHFLDETKRAKQEAEALKRNDIDLFLKLVNQSGESSANLLQNLYSVKMPTSQAIPLAIALSKHILNGVGAVRVHGGGFGGTIQAFVPNEMVKQYKEEIERVFGDGACHQMRIRPVGGVEIIR